VKRHTRFYRFLVTGLMGLSLLTPALGSLSIPAPVSAEDGTPPPTATATPPGIECENELCT
jgi:hypothetical protein